MPQKKQKYHVYLLGLGHGCYSREYSRAFMGETWAVSKAQAVNNIHFRIVRSGERLPNDIVDSMGLGYVTYVLKAERA